jgi:hypothetical protein
MPTLVCSDADDAVDADPLAAIVAAGTNMDADDDVVADVFAFSDAPLPTFNVTELDGAAVLDADGRMAVDAEAALDVAPDDCA